MKKSTTFFAILLLTISTGFAQTIDFVNSFGSLGFERPTGLALDSDKNIYNTGLFLQTVDFDPGSGVFELTSNGSEDIYITKSTPDGTIIWAKQIGGTQSDESSQLTLDDQGNIYLTGTFSGTADFDPSSAVTELTSAGFFDGFILKLDTDGNFIYVKQFSSPISSLRTSTITIDASGDLIVSGRFRDTVDFDPGAGVFELTASTASDGIFILKLTSDGNFVWAKGILGNGQGRIAAIDTDQTGNIIASGEYNNGSRDFDPSSNVFVLATRGIEWAMFVLKLDTNGDLVWAKQITGTAENYGGDVVVDSVGDIYLNGFYQGTLDFDPGSGIFELTSNGSFDIYTMKLNANGDYIWATSVGGPSFDLGINLDITPDNELLNIGIFRGTVDFDSSNDVNEFTALGNQDVFVSRTDANGNYIDTFIYGGPDFDHGFIILTDDVGDYYITGFFGGTSDFDPGMGEVFLTSNGNADGYVLKLNKPTLDITKSNYDNEIQLYPNPVRSVLTIINTSNLELDTAQITDITGKVIMFFNLETMGLTKEISLENFASGLYFVKINTLSGALTKRILKN
ncbi:T9SS type A sorting domain-containing protein [Subsaximicrobium wynnwilliamsii]|uniref:T9SS type A sorting domain-containing protein n=1 Tax=Subsaximicrobium wynnwilliamsii TaxID=291179 RepID=A0A5C6ZKD7_9FLAO|nr:T9SS type A sorting domain-containing protein [Subsaximicrobium wynnwilliamsii]TXD84617.1 T9SS type A sorting domain-containing protein [Subsaximicrobium wynnwilliamsii]TXD90299.1 T9SS type A sorting domain-containing protein [Subsaximicrobium wynnwilliamsii]TXE04350.1 T9SS type A sorting domain-containing protein [Subsaximicrobium wynnwilliamsii]